VFVRRYWQLSLSTLGYCAAAFCVEGTPGRNGITGASGAIGVKGENGATGASGLPGLVGATGLTASITRTSLLIRFYFFSIYTVSPKKQDTKLLAITSLTINRFSIFFH